MVRVDIPTSPPLLPFAPASPIDPLEDTPPPSCDLQTEADARDRRRGRSHSQPTRTASRHADALGLASPAATPTPTLAPASPEAKNHIDAPPLPDEVSKETPPPIQGYAVADHQDAAVADHQDVVGGGASDTSWTRTRPSPIRNRTLLSRIPGRCRRRRLRYPHQPPEMPLPTTSTSSKMVVRGFLGSGVGIICAPTKMVPSSRDKVKGGVVLSADQAPVPPTPRCCCCCCCSSSSSSERQRWGCSARSPCSYFPPASGNPPPHPHRRSGIHREHQLHLMWG